MTTDLPWSPGAATGVGSLPGDDPGEAARIVAGELPGLPHLAELPDRGPGADMVGRTAAGVLVGLEVDLQPAGWRLVSHAGLDARRARTLLSHDLDALEEAAPGRVGPVKVQACGPWTLAASLERPRGGPALGDAGATRDLAESLAEGIAAHVEDVRRRLPGAAVIVQLDEPSLPAVLRGDVPTASGFGRIGAVDGVLAREALSRVVSAVSAAGAWPMAHCCARDVPLRLLYEAGIRAVSFDTTHSPDDDEVGQLVEAGLALVLGCVPATDPDPDTALEAGAIRAPIVAWWRRIGLPAELLATRSAVSPRCGLAGASPSWARRAMSLAAQVGRELADAD